jgi:hypothetical protein
MHAAEELQTPLTTHAVKDVVANRMPELCRRCVVAKYGKQAQREVKRAMHKTSGEAESAFLS